MDYISDELLIASRIEPNSGLKKNCLSKTNHSILGFISKDYKMTKFLTTSQQHKRMKLSMQTEYN